MKYTSPLLDSITNKVVIKIATRLIDGRLKDGKNVLCFRFKSSSSGDIFIGTIDLEDKTNFENYFDDLYSMIVKSRSMRCFSDDDFNFAFVSESLISDSSISLNILKDNSMHSGVVLDFVDASLTDLFSLMDGLDEDDLSTKENSANGRFNFEKVIHGYASTIVGKFISSPLPK